MGLFSYRTQKDLLAEALLRIPQKRHPGPSERFLKVGFWVHCPCAYVRHQFNSTKVRQIGPKVSSTFSIK